MDQLGPGEGAWRKRLYTVIFAADTPSGRLFDVLLIACILSSVLVVILSTVQHIDARHGTAFDRIEWGFTALFTVEYLLRLACVDRPRTYALSFFGIVDLLAVAPAYLAVVLPAGEFFMVVRVLRVVRVFRVLKLMPYVGASRVLARALSASRRKIVVFLYYVCVLIVVFGSAMYVIEGEEAGFTSIPVSIYWAVVTLTTVGYGDISPQTPLGQALSSVIMILGYGIIAVPTGIVSVEMARESRPTAATGRACPHCAARGHDPDAAFCKRCGGELDD